MRASLGSSAMMVSSIPFPCSVPTSPGSTHAGSPATPTMRHRGGSHAIKAIVDLAVEAREAGEEKVILFDLTTKPGQTSWNSVSTRTLAALPRANLATKCATHIGT